jgi:hypothetical protein
MLSDIQTLQKVSFIGLGGYVSSYKTTWSFQIILKHLDT